MIDDPRAVQRELARVPLRAPLGLPARVLTHAQTLWADPRDFASRAVRRARTQADRATAAMGLGHSRVP